MIKILSIALIGDVIMGFVRQLTGTTRRDAARVLPPPLEPLEEDQVDQPEQTVNVEEEERRRRRRLFAGIQTSPLGVQGTLGQTGRSQLFG